MKLATTSDILSLPTGGVEYSGIGEKFQPDLCSGTGNFTVPLTFFPGVNGVTPDVSLRYSTGTGNGPFGLGWQLWCMRVCRSTGRGVPTYDDSSDTFILSGSEELVDIGGDRYRPRSDSKNWLIKRQQQGWSVRTKDNTEYRFGTDDSGRIQDESGRLVYAWLLQETVDTSGNDVRYSYVRDHGALYLKAINYSPFQVEFQYEDRPDMFVDRRSGFPVEMRRRCTGIVFTSARAPGAVLRRYELKYGAPERSSMSLLSEIVVSATDGADIASLPPLRLEYAPFDVRKTGYDRFEHADGFPPPAELTSGNIALIDLAGHGLPDVLANSEVGLMYWKNKGRCRWARPSVMKDVPADVRISGSEVQFADMEGNGTADLLLLSRFAKGFYPNAGEGRWESFVPYKVAPPFDIGDPNFRLCDIDGDGRIDGIYTGASEFLLYANRGRAGWDREPSRVRRIHDLSKWPDVMFSNDAVYLADMTGDGLTDIVTVHSGEIAYWPYLGHGQWGARQFVQNAPVLPRDWQRSRLFVVDVDNDGVADLLYVNGDSAHVWLNHAGQRYGSTMETGPIPPVAEGGVVMADMRGVGRPGLLFSFAHALPGGDAYRYLSLGDDGSPYRLVSIDNGMGAVTRIEYQAASQYRIADEDAGRPWRTFLPFPIQVVSAVVVRDRFSGVEARTDYLYHDGHYDGVDREFRGFGQVEEIEHGDSSAPTIVRRNRFHLGVEADVSEGERRKIGGTEREGLRALRGVLVELEVYSRPFDATAAENELRERTIHDWGTRAEAATFKPVIFPYLQRTRHTAFGGASGNIVTVTTWGDYDSFGNPLKVERTSAREIGNQTSETLYTREEFQYARPVTAELWSVGLPCRRTVYDAQGKVLTSLYSYYDGQPFIGLPAGQVAQGRLIREAELILLQTDTAFAQRGIANPDVFGYFAHGNQARGDRGWYRHSFRCARNSTNTISELKDPLGRSVRITYDGEGIDPIEVVDAAGQIIRGAYNRRRELLEAVTSPTGYVDRREYDPLGRTRRIYRSGADATPSLFKSIQYDDATDLVPASITTLICRVAGLNAAVVEDSATPLLRRLNVIPQRTYYSGLGLELTYIGPSSDSTSNRPRTITTAGRRYNCRGKLNQEGFPKFGSGFEYTPSDPGLQPAQFSFTYDYLGQVVGVTRPDGFRKAGTFHPSNLELFEEAAPQSPPVLNRTHEWDPWRRLVRVSQKTMVNSAIETSYSYSENVTSGIREASSAGVRIVKNDYDAIGRKIAIESADAGKTYYSIDAADNIIEVTNSQGTKLRRYFDVINRLTRVTRRDGDVETELQNFIYDTDPDRPGAQFVMGRLCRVTDESGRTDLRYDGAGNVTRESRANNAGANLTMNRKYDFLGNVTEITYPDGTAVEYRFNAANLLAAVPGIIDSIEYDALALPFAVRYSNGTVTEHNYNLQNRRLDSTRVLDPRGLVLTERHYAYDVVGNVIGIDENGLAGARSFKYEYDVATRLTLSRRTSASTDVSCKYGYDRFDNLVVNEELGTEPYEYREPASPNRVTSYPASNGGNRIRVQYDAGGNATSRGDSEHFWYDEFGRLRKFVGDATTVNLSYDYADRLVAKETRLGVAVTRTEFFGGLYESDGQSSVSVVRTSLGSTARVRRHAGSAEVEWFHSDHLGSTRLITDSSATVRAAQAYSALGRNLISDSPVAGYLGARYDQDLRLYHFGSRFYDPVIGKFLTPDSYVLQNLDRYAGTPRQLNLYTYAGNNPVRFTDPSGRLFWVIIAGILIGAALGYGAAKEHGANPWVGALVGGIIGGLTGGFGLLGSAVTGAGIGALVGAATGDKVFTSAALGFAFGAFSGAADVWLRGITVAGEGFGVDVANFAIEVAKDAVVGGLYGGARNAITGQSVLGGFSSGLVWGAVLGSAKVAVFGIRYDPLSEGRSPGRSVKLGDIEKKFKEFSEKQADGLKDAILKNGMPTNLIYRRHGAINLFEKFAGITLGDSVSLAESAKFDATVIAHELQHVAQEAVVTVGSLEFYLTYLFKESYYHKFDPQ